MIRSGPALLLASDLAKAWGYDATPMEILLAASLIQKRIQHDEMDQLGQKPEPRLRIVINHRPTK